MNLNSLKIRRNARWLLRLTALVIGLFIYQKISANDEPIPVFELTESFMGQPYYVIKIYRDGKVYYHGDMVLARGKSTQSVGVIGDRYAELTQTQQNELIVYFLSMPFELSKKYEMKRGNEITGHRINYKDFYMSIYMNDPVFYAVLTKRLDKLINIRQWVCFPKDHPEYKTCLLRDDAPDTIESFFK
ncbi:hypothetical protein RO575_07690 [Methylomonas sp. MO1]|uniref:hypothetical protein n=1 Tax=unclassified Methylomonas TaxID=2608980 RepID=UPI00149231D3|nr:MULTISPECIES: hypothetical protein [unclassified Methylomonas]MDT4289437.1 hypothetical protein [Methylomonas sp. MO1]NOV31919.1 hypothetical protein [Methylomonas sp. ZR1]